MVLQKEKHALWCSFLNLLDLGVAARLSGGPGGGSALRACLHGGVVARFPKGPEQVRSVTSMSARSTWTFAVEGAGEFPFEMLRHDRCWPASAADAVLVRANLTGLLVLLHLSKASMQRVTFNFAWSAVYNVFAILLAAGAFVSIGSNGGLQARIPPAYAGLGEIVSVLPVILAALLLRWVRIPTA